MIKFISHMAIVLSVLFVGKVSAQDWTLVDALPENEFTAVQSAGDKLYAAKGNVLYSTADGINWQPELIHPLDITPTCIAVFEDVIYVGTVQDGVHYRSLAAGSPWGRKLPGLHISHFLVHDSSLYLCSQGSGVWKNTGGSWSNQTSNLPMYSYTVQKIVSINGNLLAFAGANGTFYRFDTTSSTWIEDYYGEGLQPGLMIDDGLANDGVIFAANGNRLIRSSDNGEQWTTDHEGLTTGMNRILFKGTDSIYSLTTDLFNFTHLQKRSLNAPSQSTWSTDEILLFYAYGIAEFNDKIYIASDIGLLSKANGSLGIGDPTKSPSLTLFPSPSTDGVVNLISDVEIDALEVYDINGRLILSKNESTLNATITIPAKGLYLVKIYCNGQITNKKVVVQ